VVILMDILCFHLLTHFMNHYLVKCLFQTFLVIYCNWFKRIIKCLYHQLRLRWFRVRYVGTNHRASTTVSSRAKAARASSGGRSPGRWTTSVHATSSASLTAWTAIGVSTAVYRSASLWECRVTVTNLCPNYFSTIALWAIQKKFSTAWMKFY